MVIHSFYFTPEEAGRIESAVRRGIRAQTASRVGNVDIVAAHHGSRTIEVSFSIPALGECRALRFRRDEQSSEEIERRVRERLADL
jgi:hypothetical protein